MEVENADDMMKAMEDTPLSMRGYSTAAMESISTVLKPSSSASSGLPPHPPRPGKPKKKQEKADKGDKAKQQPEGNQPKHAEQEADEVEEKTPLEIARVLKKEVAEEAAESLKYAYAIEQMDVAAGPESGAQPTREHSIDASMIGETAVRGNGSLGNRSLAV